METTSAIKAKRKIKNNFYICFSGIFFCFSAFRSVIDLQSSINIEHGLGKKLFIVITVGNWFYEC